MKTGAGWKCVRVLVASIALFPLVSHSIAQSGPDNDPNGAQGYTKSVFNHDQIDSINLFNGQLTIPLPIGPAYPIGPKLSLQLLLVYNSRTQDYGSPKAGSQIDWPSPVRPVVGNPALGIGWNFTLGSIRKCRQGGQAIGLCYFSPDGAAHFFSGAKTLDATQFYLEDHRTDMSVPVEERGYWMWDGDGNKYIFSHEVTGLDDNLATLPGYVRDFGFERDGWYLKKLVDPFANSFTVAYQPGSTIKCWAYDSALPCMQTRMICPTGGNSWVPASVTLPNGLLISIVLDSNGMIDSMAFPVRTGYATWDFVHTVDTAFPVLRECDYTPPPSGIHDDARTYLRRLTSIVLPTTGNPSYGFAYGPAPLTLMAQLTLPTGASVHYDYGSWVFFHGRRGSLEAGCTGITAESQFGLFVDGTFTCLSAPRSPRDVTSSAFCSGENDGMWSDLQPGVVARTETVGSASNVTEYHQYAFPYGEKGKDAIGFRFPPQNLTIVKYPAEADGTRKARGFLFNASNGNLASAPGDRIGANIEERVYDGNPIACAVDMPACGNSNGSLNLPFCSDKAVRVTRRTFEYSAVNERNNRRLLTETTYFGPTAPDGSCTNCKQFGIVFSKPSGGTWENQGRHYELETQSTNIGLGSVQTVRTIKTAWNAQTTFPNFLSRRTDTETLIPNPSGPTSTRKETDTYFHFDTTTGFMKGSATFDAMTRRIIRTCRYSDSAGNAADEVTGSRVDTSYTVFPASFPCPALVTGWSGADGTIGGSDGRVYGKRHTYQRGQRLTTAWLSGSSPLSWKAAEVVRHDPTGWVTSSTATDGFQTTYTHDSLGRVLTITPPDNELPSTITYDNANQTTVARGDTLQRYIYDALGRLTREIRQMPGTNKYSVKTYGFDGAGHRNFESEWGACTSLTGNCTTTSPGGTTWSDFDPFGRARQIVKADGATTTISYDDGLDDHSDTKKAVTVQNVNCAWTGAACTGGQNTTTTSDLDAFGRLKSVTEPGGDQTTYSYDTAGRLVSVTAGTQSRSFRYDSFGFLIQETTPEKGTVDYQLTTGSIIHSAYGGLGNLLRKTEAGPVVTGYTYDPAARLLTEVGASNVFQTNAYDSNTGCPGGAFANCGRGKLTSQEGRNPLFPKFNGAPAPMKIRQDFLYAGRAGRLSKKTTSFVNDAGVVIGPSPLEEAWKYTTLGLVEEYEHPRIKNPALSGTPNGGLFREIHTYARGLVTQIRATGRYAANSAAQSFASEPVVASVQYHPSGLIAGYVANNGVETVISADPSGIPRPTRFKATVPPNPSALFDTENYVFDGAGNIVGMRDDAGALIDSFTYDVRSRVDIATYSGSGSRDYSYDRHGNQGQYLPPGCKIDINTNRLTHITPPSCGFAYDARGNLTTLGSYGMLYDALNRQYAQQAVGTTVFDYLFDAGDERLVKAFHTSAAAQGVTVTRREAARYILQAKQVALSSTCNPSSLEFNDVPCSDPDWQYVDAFGPGYTAGCHAPGSPALFCPDSTLTREQIAIFLVKARHGTSYSPPACVPPGPFSDVLCASPFAIWIQQLKNDGVTAGCGGTNYCPTASLPEWQMQVLAIYTNPPTYPNGFFNFHPVPTSSFFTLRDSANRIATEQWDSFPKRDNVYLGNMLVASMVTPAPNQPASSRYWEYYTTDHLGSPRLAISTLGPITVQKYWPYGELVAGTPPAQRLQFAAMEKDDESGTAGHLYNHARTYSLWTSRFGSPDLLLGKGLDVQSWNRFTYSRSNPLLYVDPNGLDWQLARNLTAAYHAGIQRLQSASSHLTSMFIHRAAVEAKVGGGFKLGNVARLQGFGRVEVDPSTGDTTARLKGEATSSLVKAGFVGQGSLIVKDERGFLPDGLRPKFDGQAKMGTVNASATELTVDINLFQVSGAPFGGEFGVNLTELNLGVADLLMAPVEALGSAFDTQDQIEVVDREPCSTDQRRPCSGR